MKLYWKIYYEPHYYDDDYKVEYPLGIKFWLIHENSIGSKSDWAWSSTEHQSERDKLSFDLAYKMLVKRDYSVVIQNLWRDNLLEISNIAYCVLKGTAYYGTGPDQNYRNNGVVTKEYKPSFINFYKMNQKQCLERMGII